MQTMLLVDGRKNLIGADEILSFRCIHYKTPHSVPRTRESTFDSQEESDPTLESPEVSLGPLGEELRVFAK